MYRDSVYNNTPGHQSITYEDCSNLFAKARNKVKGKRLQSNTLLKKDGDKFLIRLYDTEIIAITPQNVLTLDSGGYKTNTTKYRINELTCANISQAKKVWYIKDTEFFDGIQIDLKGNVLNPLTETIKESLANKHKLLDKLITRYCDGFQAMVEAGELKVPSSADCWYCSLVTNEGVCLGDATTNDDHIIQHLREQYFVPSLLYNAIKTKKYYDPALIFHMIQHNKNGKMARRELRYFFRKKYESLLKLV
jgi:hypothetical protein